MNVKAIVFALFLVLPLIFSSCSSINKELLKGIQNVALVSVFSDKQLDVSQLGSDNILSAINALSQSDAFDLSKEINGVRDDFFNKYTTYLPFKLVEEKTVFGAPEYQALVKKQASDALYKEYAKPAGYVVIYPISIGDDEVKKALACYTAADAVMMAEIKYKLVKDPNKEIFGFGVAKLEATMYIKVVNKQGKELMFINETAESSGELQYSLGGVFEAKDAIMLVKDATSAVSFRIFQFLERNK